jgi:hypothetical protein
MMPDRQAPAVKPRDKACKLADRNSLFLHVTAKAMESERRLLKERCCLKHAIVKKRLLVEMSSH